MKRVRQLDEVVDEIIEIANTRDEQGRCMLDAMQEDPAVVMLFYSRFALIEMIRDKPLRFLKLLQTNKKVNDFFSGFKNIWIILLDSFVESYASVYYSEIYPFFLVQNQRARGGDYGPTRLHYMMKTDYPDITKIVPVPQRYLDQGVLQAEVPYYLVHYDELTRRYIDILQRVRDLGKWMRMPILLSDLLSNYVGKDTRLIAYYDYFLVDVPKPAIAYNKEALYEDFEQIAVIVKSYQVVTGKEKDNKGYYGTTQVKDMYGEMEYLFDEPLELLQYLKKQVLKLEKFIERTKDVEGALAEPIKIVPLDKSTALPYRQMLFDEKEGVYYKTVEEQKKLFKDIFMQAYPNKYDNGGTQRKEFIEKFSAPLQCAFCDKETHIVDIKRSLAVCSLECREKLAL